MLLLMFLMNTSFNFLIFQPGGLANRKMSLLHLGPEQPATALSVPFLANAFLGIPVGALADRFGAKRVILIRGIIAMIGSLGRIGSGGFISLILWMFALGIGPALLNATIPKVLGSWFELQEVGRAMGLYIAGANAGITLALSTSALLTSVVAAFVLSSPVIIPLGGPNLDPVFLLIGSGYLVFSTVTSLIPELGVARGNREAGAGD